MTEFRSMVNDTKRDRWKEAIAGADLDGELGEVLATASREVVLADLEKLFEMGAQPTQALDIWATKICGLETEEWAEVRDRDVHAVYNNIQKGRRNITALREEYDG